MRHFKLQTLVNIVSIISTVFGLRDPYRRIEAESLDLNNGVSIRGSGEGADTRYVDEINAGDVIGYKQFNFSAETIAFQMQMACYSCGDYPNRKMILRLDCQTSTPFVTYNVPSTDDHWFPITQLIPVRKRPRGVHDLYFTFEHSKSSNYVVAIDWFIFVAEDTPPKPQCPSQPVIQCPNTATVTCPTSQPIVHSPTDHSIDNCDDSKSTDSNKHIIINVY